MVAGGVEVVRGLGLTREVGVVGGVVVSGGQRCGGSCTCRLRINTPGSSVDRHRGQKGIDSRALMASQCPLTPGDALTAGRMDARRLRRPAHLPTSPHHGWLTPPLAAATAARESAGLRARSRYGPSTPLPWVGT